MRSRPAARASRTMSRRPASSAISSTNGRSTARKASPAPTAPAPAASSASYNRTARHSIVPSASVDGVEWPGMVRALVLRPALAGLTLASPCLAGSSLVRASLVQPAAGAQSYVPGTEDVPLMPGLAADDSALIFDKPQGRIVEAAARGA